MNGAVHILLFDVIHQTYVWWYESKNTSATRFFWDVRRSFEKLTPTIFGKVFANYIRPILGYGHLAVYLITNGESLPLNGVQRWWSKLVAGVWNRTYPQWLAQLNMFSLGFRRVRGDLIYTWRILNVKLGEDVRGYFSSFWLLNPWPRVETVQTEEIEAWSLYGSVLQGSEPVECLASWGCWVYNKSWIQTKVRRLLSPEDHLLMSNFLISKIPKDWGAVS